MSRTRSPMTSRSNWANERSTLRLSHPMLPLPHLFLKGSLSPSGAGIPILSISRKSVEFRLAQKKSSGEEQRGLGSHRPRVFAPLRAKPLDFQHGPNLDGGRVLHYLNRFAGTVSGVKQGCHLYCIWHPSPSSWFALEASQPWQRDRSRPVLGILQDAAETVPADRERALPPDLGDDLARKCCFHYFASH